MFNGSPRLRQPSILVSVRWARLFWYPEHNFSFERRPIICDMTHISLFSLVGLSQRRVTKPGSDQGPPVACLVLCSFSSPGIFGHSFE